MCHNVLETEGAAKIYQKSDYLIVVKTPVKVGVAKGGNKTAFLKDNTSNTGGYKKRGT